jgi:formiminoglutamase
MDWLHINRGDAPLIVAFPHAGTALPACLADAFVSPWLARRDADWWIDRLHGFATDLGATTIRTDISRSVIDVNRDPSGASLYPGQATTALCPTTTFDGDPLYEGTGPDGQEIARRRAAWFDPYHAALAAEITRLRMQHEQVILYDAHSIRSHIPRLFDGALPQFNIGTNSGTSCDERLTDRIATLCADSGHSHVRNGRFKGGWTTRHYGQPDRGVHAVQMELAMRGYMTEPPTPAPGNWPPPYSPDDAAPMAAILAGILQTCIRFVSSKGLS